VQGTWVDIICRELQNHAAANARELIAATRTELDIDANSRATIVLLIALEFSKLSEAMPLFSESLASPNEQVRECAVRGLENLDSKEARRLLFEHRSNQSQRP
jgi:HEAT repeat protein